MNGGCWLALRTPRLHRSSATMCLVRGAEVALPERQGWDAFIHAYRGRIDVNGTSLETKEGLLLVNETEVWVRALEDAIAVAFLINPKARVTHAGTIGL